MSVSTEDQAITLLQQQVQSLQQQINQVLSLRFPPSNVYPLVDLPVSSASEQGYLIAADPAARLAHRVYLPDINAAARVVGDKIDGLISQSNAQIATALASGRQAITRAVSDGLDEINTAINSAAIEASTVLAAAGYFVPVAYSDGLDVSSSRFTVSYGGDVYAADAGAVPFVTTDVFDSSKWHVLQGVTASDLAANSGAEMVGTSFGDTVGGFVSGQRISTIGSLRSISPAFDGIRSSVLSHSDWITSSYGLPVGGGNFIHVAGLDASKFKDDGGTIIVTSDDKVWIREELLKDGPIIRVEWFGADNTYTSDSTSAIQAACDAALFWLTTGQINTAYTTGGPIGPKPTVVMPRAWRITSTITVNMSYVEIDLNNSVGLIDNSGTYATNPADSDYTVAFLCNGTLIDGLPYISAYYHGNFMRNGTLVYGSLNSKGGINRNALSDSKVVGAHFYGSTSTLWSAVSTINNVAFSSFGAGFTNGDYGWGYTLNDCKYENCYRPYRLYAAADNGEKMLFINNMVFNCGYFGDMNTWPSDFKWIGGSWDYAKVGGFLANSGGGGSAVIDLSPGRVEYNPAQAPTLVDASGSQNIVHFHDAYVKFAAPSGALAGSGTLFKMAYHDQLTLDHCAFKDVSWSATACQNLKITNDYRYYRRGNHSYTLPDYFINRGGVNSKNINSWTVSPASSYLTCTKNLSANTLTITSSATSPIEQILYLFVPMDVPQVSQLLTAMMTASKPDVALSVTFGIGFLNNGAVNSNLFIAGLMGIKNGVTYPYVANSDYTVGSVVSVPPGAPYDGLYMKINLYNLIAGSGSVVIDCAGTGLIHV